MSTNLLLGKGHAKQTAPACCLLFLIARLFVTLNYLTFRLIAATTEKKRKKGNLRKLDENCRSSLALSQHATGSLSTCLTFKMSNLKISRSLHLLGLIEIKKGKLIKVESVSLPPCFHNTESQYPKKSRK